MSKVKHWFLFVLCFLMLFFQKSTATHIVGGEMNYRYLGSNIYEVTLTVYRDCYNGVAPFDNPASIAAYNSSGSLVASSSVYITTQGLVANAINTPCLIPPSNICYEVATYVYTIALPPIPGGYTLTYQRCCRNSSVINLQNVQGTGATYFATIPDSSISTFNSNPKFINWPPTFICKDAPFTFNHSAIDYEGDSLVYSISVPYSGADQINPKPVPPNPPPYPQVIYANPYSVSNVFGGTPLEINSQTGILKATPNSLGQFVYGVTVKEYRNGIYLGETTRDFQVNVVSCPMITVASIFSPTISCGTLEANFENTSYNAATYSWNFGEPGTTSDTSSLLDPSYTYADTGDYVATLIAYSGINPLCNDTAVGIVHIYPVFNSFFDIQNVHCSSDFSFFDRSYGIGGVANFWQWNFGDDSTSTVINPQHSYSEPGNYIVSLITSADSSCFDTLSKPITVLRNPISGFNLILDTCTYTIRTIDSSQYASAYRWNFGDGLLNFDRRPTHTFSSAGNYNVQQIVFTDSTCIDTSSLSISIPPLPLIDFSYSVATCDSVVQFSNQTTNAESYLWNFGDGDTSSTLDPIHTYQLSGKIPVKLTAESLYGCVLEDIKDIEFISFKKAEFSTKQDSCSGALNFINVTENAFTYHWEFSDGKTSEVKNPVHFFSQYGENFTFLYVNGESECPDSTSRVHFTESPLGEILYVPNTFTPNDDGVNDFFVISAFRPCLVYSIEIFNRWGQKIYENDDASSMQWDGRYKDQMVESDIYVYILKNSEQQRTGIVNLIK